MRLTQFSNFAVRILMHIALTPDRPTPLPEIARAYGSSYEHMKKVAAELCRLGYLEAVRGRDGGFRLASDPARIGIGEVVRATEGDVVLVECFDATTNTCPLEPACLFRQALQEGLAAFFAALDRYTLADLVDAPEALALLLAPPRG